MKLHTIECTTSELPGLEAMLARQGYRLIGEAAPEGIRPGEYIKFAVFREADSINGSRQWTLMWGPPTQAAVKA